MCAKSTDPNKDKSDNDFNTQKGHTISGKEGGEMMWEYFSEDDNKDHTDLELCLRNVLNEYRVSPEKSLVDRYQEGFGRYVRAARKSQGITVSELAKKSGVTPDVINDIESLSYPIEQVEDDWVRKLATALEQNEMRTMHLLGRVSSAEFQETLIEEEMSSLEPEETIINLIKAICAIVQENSIDVDYILNSLPEGFLSRLDRRFIVDFSVNCPLSTQQKHKSKSIGRLLSHLLGRNKKEAQATQTINHHVHFSPRK